jgi:hypothetical protein
LRYVLSDCSASIAFSQRISGLELLLLLPGVSTLVVTAAVTALLRAVVALHPLDVVVTTLPVEMTGMNAIMTAMIGITNVATVIMIVVIVTTSVGIAIVPAIVPVAPMRESGISRMIGLVTMSAKDATMSAKTAPTAKSARFL